MELKRILSIILRRKWIIIQAFLVISLSSIIGTYLLHPVYKVTSKILIKRSESESYALSNLGLKPLQKKNVLNSDMDDYLELVVARPVLEKVISKLQLKDRDGELIAPDILRNYTPVIYELSPRPCIQVEIVDRNQRDESTSNQIEITARSTDPDEAAMIANTLAEEYSSENLIMKKNEYKTARENIENQIDSVKSKYLRTLEDIKNFQTNTGILDIDTEKRKAISKIYDLLKEEQHTVISISEVIAELNELKKQLSTLNEENISSEFSSGNDYLAQLRNSIVQLELKLEKELSDKTPKHPDVIALNQQLKKAKEDLQKEILNLIDTSTEKQKLERDLAALEDHRKTLGDEITQYMVKYDAIPQKIFVDSQLKLAYQTNQSIYSSLLDNLNQLIATESIVVSDVNLVEAAQVPAADEPYFPKIVQDGIVGIFLGLIFGFGLGFLVDYLDDTIRGAEDIKDYGIPFLGYIPRAKSKKSPVILQKTQEDQVSEFYRTIANYIKFSCIDKHYKTLLITSATKGEGRSTIAINLGITFTREHKKVLIVDMDFLNPKIDKILGVTVSDGITNILTDNALPKDVIQPNENIEGLSILSVGSNSPPPIQTIESDRMRQLISGISEEYDIVILDSSPLLLSNDAISLAQFVDASILVLESGKISHRNFARMIDYLRNTHVQLLGTIINKFPVSRGRGSL